MKLQLEKWTFDGSISYKLVNLDLCCDKITDNKVIDFHNGWFSDSYGCYAENKIGIALHEMSPNLDCDGYLETYDEYYEIRHCPFCGAEIHIEIVSEVDKTDEYLNLQTKVYDLRKEINKCDSKKKSYELECEFRKTDTELNSFYNNVTIQNKKSEIYDEDY